MHALAGRPLLWAKVQPFTAPAVIPVMICRAATKVKIRGGMAIRLPIAITLPQSTPMSQSSGGTAYLPHTALYCVR